MRQSSLRLFRAATCYSPAARNRGCPSHPHFPIPALDPNWVDPWVRSWSPLCSRIRWPAARSTSGKCNDPGGCRGNGFRRIPGSESQGRVRAMQWLRHRQHFLLLRMVSVGGASSFVEPVDVNCPKHATHENLHLYFWRSDRTSPLKSSHFFYFIVNFNFKKRRFRLMKTRQSAYAANFRMDSASTGLSFIKLNCLRNSLVTQTLMWWN